MKLSISIITLPFCGFVAWLLFMANTEQDSFIFRLAHSLPLGDKLAHILIFGLLALLLNLTFRNKTYSFGDYPIPWGSLAVFLFATLEEGSQYYLPSRTFDLLDYLASLLGILIFSAFAYHKRVLASKS